MPGSSRMVCAGPQKVVLLRPVAATLRSSVSAVTFRVQSDTSRDAELYLCGADDPQMPGLIPLIKKVRPDLPIIYRSHIEIRSDLVHIKGSPQEEVWQYLWNNIQHADLFISHPVNKFVPSDVPSKKLTLLGAATDW